MELKLDSVTEFLEEQEWYQQLKSKWEELDPQSRLYLKIAGIVSGALLLLFILISSLLSVQQLKHDLTRRRALLNLIQSASDEIHGLRSSGVPTDISAPTGPWTTYFETLAGGAGIDKSELTVSSTKEGTPGAIAKESHYDLALKKSTIRQVVKFAYSLETGARPVKLLNLSIDTHADPSGYIDATLSVSAFTPIEKQRGS